MPFVTIRVGSYGAPVLSNAEVAEMGKNCVYQVLVTKSPSIRRLVVGDGTLTVNDRCNDPEADYQTGGRICL